MYIGVKNFISQYKEPFDREAKATKKAKANLKDRGEKSNKETLAEEIDLVRSGLEETMISSFHQIMEVYHGYEKVNNLRDAAFITALNKVAGDYMTLCVFP